MAAAHMMLFMVKHSPRHLPMWSFLTSRKTMSCSNRQIFRKVRILRLHLRPQIEIEDIEETEDLQGM